MATRNKAKKFENVEIQFVNIEDAQALNATVLVRNGEMVIDIQALDGITDYLIVGKPEDYFFQGINSAGKAMPTVRAKWVKLGRIYVGLWIEGGREYLFSFELNQ